MSIIEHEKDHDKLSLDDHIKDLIIKHAPVGGGGGGARTTSFLNLTDTPTEYTGNELYFVRVNDEGTGLEFTASSTVVNWGGINGDITDQTDLQEALNLKVNTADIGTVATSNSYNDLDDLPTIPTLTSQLTNDSGYLTSFTETDPVFGTWLSTTPPLYPGGWYDADQNTIALSGFNDDLDYADGTHASQHAVSGADTIFPADPDADKYLMWDNDPGVLVWADVPASGATTALDNLASVAINTSLISDTDNTDDLGSSEKEWKDLYIDGTAYIDNIEIATGETITGDGTDLTIASGGDIALTATGDINIPVNVGLEFAGTEKIESDGTDLNITVGATGDINIGANIGLTFGDDGEKIEGDGTDLTINSSAKLNLTATSDVIVPVNVGIILGDGAEKIESDNTDLTINSGADINLTATADINVPANVGITFGDDGEKIEGDGTNLTIASSGTLSLNSTGVITASYQGIADNAVVTVDQDGASDNDFAKFTANGLEGRSYSEVKQDLSLDNVENTAISTWAGSSNVVTVGTLTGGNVDVAVTRTVSILVTDPNGDAITTGNGKAYLSIPSEYNAYNLVGVQAEVTTVSSSGLPSIQIHNLTKAQDMLSTNLTIDANENSSTTAATPAVIDTAKDDVASGDLIRIDIDGAGTGTKGLIVKLSFRKP